MWPKLNLALSVLTAIILLIAPLSLYAATTVTNVYDQPTSLTVGVSSNHKFAMTIVSAVDEGDTLILTFPSSFDTSLISENDFDVADDGIDLTTASDCSGAEQMSIAVVADVITMTVCAGDGGTIAAGSEVEIEIGLNASASGTGIAQIENPATPGTYYVNINGTYGDYGSVPIPIISGENGGEVSAIVPEPAGSDGSTTTSDEITVTSPNGGETLTGGSTETITWTTSGSAISLVDIYYSTDGGSSYTLVASDEADDGSYSWLVPEVDTTLAAVRLEGGDSGGAIDTDESDSVFTITTEDADTVTVSAPNGGESYAGASIQTISWSSTGSGITSINLYYSTDSGSNYTPISLATDNDGTYSWIVPSVATTEALVRVVGTDGVDNLATDDSDAVFTITVATEEETPEEPTEEPAEETPTEEGGVEAPAEEITTTPETTTPTTPTETPTTTTTTPTGTATTTERTIDGEVLVGDDQIALAPQDGGFSVLSDVPVTVNITVTDSANITSIEIVYADETLSPTVLGSGLYSVTLPVGAGDQVLTVVVTYSDGSLVTEIFNVNTSASGLVYEVVEGVNAPVAGAIVIVYGVDAGVRTQWGASTYGQTNPVTTSSSGAIAWYVPNGSYVVTAGKSGYQDTEVSLTVSDNILAPSIELIREEEVPGEVPVEPTEPGTVEEPGEAPTEEVPEVTAPTFLEEILSSPAAQATADVAVPVAVATAVTAAAVLASSFELLPLLQYLFTAPILFFARRRRQSLGLVYNAYSKMPVDLAIVRLLNEQGKIVRTMVTDKEGHYFFKVDPGLYSLVVVKRGFVFPTSYLAGAHEDGKYLDLYSGGQIKVDEKEAVIAANIPLDPADQPEHHTAKSLKIKRFLRVFQQLVAVSGVLASLLVVVLRPTWLTAGLFLFNLGIYVVTRRLVKPQKRKGWGIVYDEKTQKAVPNAVVRLFEPKYNKLIESTLTDGQGRYAFMVGPNEYYTTYERGGYQKTEVRPIDYKENKDADLVSIDVPVRPAV